MRNIFTAIKNIWENEEILPIGGAMLFTAAIFIWLFADNINGILATGFIAVIFLMLHIIARLNELCDKSYTVSLPHNIHVRLMEEEEENEQHL